MGCVRGASCCGRVGARMAQAFMVVGLCILCVLFGGIFVLFLCKVE